MATSDPADTLLQIRDTIQAGRTFVAVLLGVMIWEWLSMLPREYRFVWRRKIGFISVAYAVARYWTLIATATTLWLTYIPSDKWASVCPRMVLFTPLAPVPSLLAANSIMVARLYAIYDRSKIVLCISCTFVAFCLGVQIAGPLLDDPHYKVVPPQLNVSACIPRQLRRKSSVAVCNVFGQYDGLRHALVREQILFFVMCTTATLLNTVWFNTASHKSQLAPLPVVVQTIAICRIVLHLRELGDSATDSSSHDLVVDGVKTRYLVPPRRSLTRSGETMVIAAQALNPVCYGATADKVQYELSLCSSPRSSNRPQDKRDADDGDMLEKQ